MITSATIKSVFLFFFPVTCLLFCFKHKDYKNPSSPAIEAIGNVNKSDSVVAVNSVFVWVFGFGFLL